MKNLNMILIAALVAIGLSYLNIGCSGAYSHEVDVTSTDTITIVAENGDGKTVTRTITIK